MPTQDHDALRSQEMENAMKNKVVLIENESFGLPGLPDFQFVAKIEGSFKDTGKTLPNLMAGFSQRKDCEKYIRNYFGDVAEKAEQSQVQLAGCLTAAEGATNPEHIAYKGMYGWSVAYQKTLELRLAFNKLTDKSPEEILKSGPLVKF